MKPKGGEEEVWRRAAKTKESNSKEEEKAYGCALFVFKFKPGAFSSIHIKC